MSVEQFLRALWRRKSILLLTVVLATAGAYFGGRALPKTYTASTTLFVADRTQSSNDFEAIQSGQVLATTYAELIQSENVAAEAAAALPGEVTAEELLDTMEFKPIPDTQLINVSAEAGSPEGAAFVANAYSEIFIRLAATRLARRTQSTLSIADRASPPAGPIRPDPILYAVVAFAASLLLGAGLALLRDRMDTRLTSDEDILEAFDLPVLGRITERTARRRKAKAEEERRFLEGFRVLKANLAFLRPGEGIASLAVLSASASEGKTTMAVGLARVFAEQGQRVVVIEGDMRRPTLASMLEVEPAAQGLAHFLALDIPFRDVVQRTPVRNLHIVAAGVMPPNPSALLRTESLARLAREATAGGYMLIIDSPPVSAGADASLLADAVDGTLFVVNYRRTRRAGAETALRRLRQTGAELMGIVVNRIPAAQGDDAYNYYGDTDRRPSRKPAVGALSSTEN